jgi:protocatechuate 3,4-dioxygenase beta subunit
MAADDSILWQPSRRAFFITGAAALSRLKAMPATPACTLMGEQEVGPYYLDDRTLRQNVTEGKPGLPLKLRIALVDARRCNPLPSAAVDIWQCDALGVYSGFTANGGGGLDGRGRAGMGPPPGDGGRGFGDGFGPGMPPPGPGGPGGPGGRGGMPPVARPTDASRYLRGVQLTDPQGIAEFATLYPGWYQGRAIHIHLKVHLGGSAADGKYTGGHVSHTGQLFFPEDVTDEVAKMEPYASRLSVHRTLQSEDGVFNGQHGGASMATLARLSSRASADAFVATVTLAIDPEATPAPVGGPGGGRRGPRP